jgi:hypothetical protein
MKLRLSLSLRALQAFTGIHAVTISRYVNQVCHILGQMPLAACTQSTLLVDTTCCRVATTAHHTYSGHKHQRCAKVQVLADESGQVLDVSAAHPGSVHDKTVWNREVPRLRHLLCDHVVLADKAYAGATGEHQYLFRPIKRGETLWQQNRVGSQSFNAHITKRRVRIEHLFARIKTWKVLNGMFPYRWQRLGEIVRVIAVIHNLERGACLIQEAT